MVPTPPLAHKTFFYFLVVQMCVGATMDLKLKEITLKRLLSLLVWTLLVILKRGISVLIEAIECRVFERTDPAPSGFVRNRRAGRATLLPPLTDELVFSHNWPRLHRRVNISLLWRLRRVNRAWRRGRSNTGVGGFGHGPSGCSWSRPVSRGTL